MPDVYHRITEADEATVEQLAAAMEPRATDPAQQAMLSAYLDDAELPDGAKGFGDRLRYGRDQPCPGRPPRNGRGGGG